MICKPPIKPPHNESLKGPSISIHYERDKEKLDKVIEYAKELGLQFYIGDDGEKPENYIMIKIPYKKIVLFDNMPIKAKKYKE